MGAHARVIKGDIIYSKSQSEFESIKDGYIVLFGNNIKGIYDKVPDEYKSAHIIDYTDKLIFPAFNNHIVSIENDPNVYKDIIVFMWQEGIARFNTISIGGIDRSYEFMDDIELMGLAGFFYHNRPDEKFSIYDLEEFSIMSSNNRILLYPYIFIDQYDKNFDKKLELSNKYKLKLSGVNLETDNSNKIDILESLSLLNESFYRDIDSYSIPYYSYNPYTFSKIDIGSEKNKSVEVLRNLLEEGRLGIYTDKRYSILEAIRYELNNNKLFSLNEIFFMATEATGRFFGKVGKFEEFYSFDALVVDDIDKSLSIEKRLENFLLNGKKEEVYLRYIYGMKALGN